MQFFSSVSIPPHRLHFDLHFLGSAGVHLFIGLVAHKGIEGRIKKASEILYKATSWGGEN